MKRSYSLILTLLFVFAAVSCFAQKGSDNADEKTYAKSYFGIYGGIGKPIGDFAKTDYSNNKAGYAKRGAVVGLDGAWYFYKNLGLGGTLFFQDQGSINSNDATAISNGFTTDLKADAMTTSVTNRYHTLNFLLGPQYSFLVHKFTIDLRASGGIVKSTSTPEFTFNPTGSEAQTSIFYQRSAKAYVAGYSGSLGLRYALGDSWTLSLRGTYFGSEGPTVKYDDRIVTVGRYVDRQPFSTVQATFGINLLF